MTTAIGVLHPGEMGAAVGAAARLNGGRVLWASAGRGEATRARAASAGLEDVGMDLDGAGDEELGVHGRSFRHAISSGHSSSPLSSLG